MSTIINGKKQNDVAELNSLSRNLYENIFNVNIVENGDKAFYAYNLLNKVIFPDTLDSNLIDEITINTDTPWTKLSYDLYDTIELWWMVYLLNKPKYIFKAQAGETYTYIKPEAVEAVLTLITNNNR